MRGPNVCYGHCMDDRTAITHLIYKYAACIDVGDFDGVATLFANGRYSKPDGTIAAEGSAEVRRVFDTVIVYDDGTPRTHHNITNIVIDVAEGAVEAHGSCYLTVVQGVEAQGPIETVLVGRYVDRYRKTNSGWQFADRCFQPDFAGDLSRHTRINLV